MPAGSSSLRPPPPDLRRFPGCAPRFPLYRIHRADRSPWWFSGDGSGRFDLGSGRGTCYLAEEPVGCFLEVFRSFLVIPEAEVSARRLSQWAGPPSLVPGPLADCTSGAARAFGVTGEIHSTPDYRSTQLWAEALAAAGFAGIRYRLRHDPGQRLAGVAFFGPVAPWPEPQPEPLGPDLLREAEERFGLRILPVP